MIKVKTTVNALRIGQIFEFIPKPWYWKSKLTRKYRRIDYEWIRIGSISKPLKFFKYDLVLDAAVVNPPGLEYGVRGTQKVWIWRKR